MRTVLVALLTLAIQVEITAAQGDKEKSPPATRVAVVNIGVILDKYEDARELKEILQIDPNKPAEIDKNASKKGVAAWKEIDDAISAYAEKHAINLVLGYSDPTEKDKLNTFTNVNRKMSSMDAGSVCPLSVMPQSDITKGVLDLLRKDKINKAQEKVLSAGTDRVAIVNVGLVFLRFKRAIKVKAELEAAARPFNQKAKELQDEIGEWEKATRAGNVDRDEFGELQTKIEKNRRELKDLASEIRRTLGKKSNDDLISLVIEFQAVVKNCASRDGIGLVLGYGDPLSEELVNGFPNISRKWEAHDRGFATPFFTAESVDISNGVIRLLNDPDAVPENAKERFPVLRVGTLNFVQLMDKSVAAKQLQKDLDAIRLPSEETRARIESRIKIWEAKIEKADFKAASKEDYKDRIRQARRDLEDLEIHTQRAIDKKKNTGFPLLWKGIQECNAEFAERYKFGVVLGYAGARDKRIANFAEVKRRLLAMQDGGVSLLYIAPTIELSETITGSLNQREERGKQENYSK